ncbi:MAG: hypothetical protein WDZ45_12070 [Flavobacteriaceae bacterium]
MTRIFFKPLFIIALSTFVLVSCSKDDSSDSSEESATTVLGAKATFNSGRAFAEIAITKFLVNVEDFELEFDDDDFGDDDDGGIGGNYYSDIELEGPFVLDLSNPNLVFPIATVDIPVGQYEDLEFDITRNREPSNELFQRSILIEGTINERPFIFWHDFEEDVEIEFEDTNIPIMIENDGENLIINFDLTFLFNTNVVNLTGATDGNGDGVIEISPTDQDGNNALANQIKEIMKDAIDLLDD